jgi:methyl-accepting chemotaxis protein
MALTVVAVALLLVYVQKIKTYLITNLTKISVAADRICNGAFDEKIDIASEDEIGALAKAFNVMTDSIKSQIDQNREAILHLERFVTALESHVEKQSSVVQNLKDSSTQVLSEAKLQADSASQVQSAVDEFARLLIDSEKLVKNTEDLSQTVDQQTQHALSEMGHTQTLMTNVREATQNILGSVKMIDAIAFQTNILSLNASIEAARAGALGKGFSVVAEEVRNLAGRSSNVNLSVRTAITEAMSKVAEGLSQTEQCVTGLHQVTAKVHEEFAAIQKITQNTTYQTRRITDIKSDIGKITQIILNNNSIAADMMERTGELYELIGTLRGDLHAFLEKQRKKSA